MRVEANVITERRQGSREDISLKIGMIVENLSSSFKVNTIVVRERTHIARQLQRVAAIDAN